MGILAAVAIPAYNAYRKTAALGAMQSDSSNISRAFLACSTVKAFKACDTLTEVGVTVSGSSDGKKAPLFCAHFEREIGGVKYKQCVSVNANDSTVAVQNNQGTCYEQVGTITCTNSAADIADPTKCVQSTPITPCSASTDCSTTAGVGTICDTNGSSANCGATTGKCT